MRLLLALFSLLVALGAAGQGVRDLVVPGAEVRAFAPGPDTLSATAGGTVGFGVRLEERGGVGHALRLEMQVPEGWRPLLTQPSFHLGARTSALQLVGLQVPADAQAGLYLVGVRVRGAEGWETSLRKVVRVDAQAGLSVVLLAPRFVVAGEPYTVTALVQNSGNVPATVALTTWSALRSKIDPREAEVPIEPGGVAEVEFTVQTGSRTAAATDRFRVTALLQGSPPLTDEAMVSVEVVPRGSAVDPETSWPLVGSVSAISRDGDVAPLLGLTGEVPLGSIQSGHVATFRVDGVGPASASVFSRQPEAWARYQGPSGDAQVGTGAFPLTPLTSSATFGVGARGHIQLGRADVTALLRRPWALGIDTQEGTNVGVGVGMQAGTWGRVSLNALAAGGLRGGEVATARVELLEIPGLEIDAEGGLTRWAAPRPVYRLRGAGRQGRFAMAMAAARQDGRQPGRLSSSTSQSASATLGMGAGLTGWAAWRATQRDAGRLSLFVNTSEQTAQGGARWSGPVGRVTVRAEAGGEHRQTTTPADARAITMGKGGVDITWLGTRASVDLGVGQVNVLDGVARPAWTVGGSLGWAADGISASVASTVSDGTSLLSLFPARQVSTSVNLAARFERFDIRSSFTAGHFETGLYREGDLMRWGSQLGRVEATARLDRGREVVLGGYHYRGSGAPATHLQVMLRVPLAVPLPFAAERPRIRGRFVDQATGEGIAGLLVHHGGGRVVTGADGSFAFATTPAGGYVFLDRSTLGADRVPLRAFPVLALPGEAIDVVVVPRVVLRGALRRVAIVGAGARADTTDAGAVSQAVVEAEGMGQRYRTASDAAGRFVFDDLPRGTYQLRVVRAALPDRHRLERETLTVEITDEVDVLWRVVPDRREVQMLGSRPAAGDRLTLSPSGVRAVRPSVEAAPAPPPPPSPAPDLPPAPTTLATGHIIVRSPLARVTAPAHPVDAAPALTAPSPVTPIAPVAQPDVPPAEDGEYQEARPQAPAAQDKAPRPPGLGPDVDEAGSEAQRPRAETDPRDPVHVLPRVVGRALRTASPEGVARRARFWGTILAQPVPAPAVKGRRPAPAKCASSSSPPSPSPPRSKPRTRPR